MGVPALFRWLQSKYPKIIEPVLERDEDENFSMPNPNNVEFDNLYLDVNGIIHPCSHPEDRPAPKSHEEIMLAICDYIDRLVKMIRPRRLLYIAADGVAPRAKMNQQRSRRFRAGQEKKEKENEREGEGEDNNDNEKSKEESNFLFDVNCITPGTPFMSLTMQSIRYYIADRMSKDEAWKKIIVIFSDSNVPGEGEHKIVDYIRRQRLDPQYDPNTKHVIYGLDADLIMLSLATHEPHFRVLREDVFNEQYDKRNSENKEIIKKKPFIFLNILTLRDYLSVELKPYSSFSSISPTSAAIATTTTTSRSFNLERAIDDWIFLCFFVGNDFLPHIPSLELREGAIDILIDIYRANYEKMGGPICKDGHVNLERVEIILTELGKIEDLIFRKRREREEKFLARLGSKRHQPDEEIIEDNNPLDSNKNDDTDNVRLWEPGFKERYYSNKLSIPSNGQDKEEVKKIIKAYTEGLCWVMSYYFQGCQSWKWFYPYHYAPFASDFQELHKLEIKFELGTPFLPFEQLMSVFPATSKDHIPVPFHSLMTDPKSELYHFYPEYFKIDMNGKRHAWQGVALLPFIDEALLLNAVRKVYHKLDIQESMLNILGNTNLFMTREMSKDSWILELARNSTIPIGDLNSFSGAIGLCDQNAMCTSPFDNWPVLNVDNLFVAIYHAPFYERSMLKFRSTLICGAKLPSSKLNKDDQYVLESGQAPKNFRSRLEINLSQKYNHHHQQHQHQQSSSPTHKNYNYYYGQQVYNSAYYNKYPPPQQTGYIQPLPNNNADINQVEKRYRHGNTK